MRLRLLFIVLGLGVLTFTHAQNLSPSVISPSGDVSYGPSLSLEWTLGEIAINTIHAGNRIYTEGFHQPVLFVAILETPVDFLETEYTQNSAAGDIKITAHPNPVTAILKVTVESSDPAEILLHISDLSGKLVMSTEIDPTIITTELDLRFLPSGMYLLQFREENGKMIKAYKIAKIQ